MTAADFEASVMMLLLGVACTAAPPGTLWHSDASCSPSKSAQAQANNTGASQPTFTLISRLLRFEFCCEVQAWSLLGCRVVFAVFAGFAGFDESIPAEASCFFISTAVSGQTPFFISTVASGQTPFFTSTADSGQTP